MRHGSHHLMPTTHYRKEHFMSLLKVESKQENPLRTVNWLLVNTTAGLWTAVFISIALHLLVFYFWQDNKTHNLSLGQNHFSALIVSADSPSVIPQKKTAENKKRINKWETPAGSTVAESTPETNEQLESQQPVASKDSQPSFEQSKNAILGNIQSRLSQYLSYPELARRKGWQGIVVVSLIVNESGNFKDIQVNSSSGFAILDNTALTALKKLNTIDIKKEFNLALNTTLEIPIHFKLKGT